LVKIKINMERCNGNGICVEVCPLGVYELKDKKAVPINIEKCNDCRICEWQCPTNAIIFEEK
jgi:NAD-dependent dihydropyrimidine dehydrogenase PreA subunit